MKGAAVAGLLVGVAVLGAVGLALASTRRAFRAVFVKVFDTAGGKQSFWDVFDGSDRIVRYSQNNDDRTSRVFIDSPLPATDARRVRAMKEFGIRSS